MATQTNYGDLGVAYAGMVANTELANFVSRTVEDSAGLAFGVAVDRGSDDQGCVFGAGGAFLGFSVRDRSLDANTPNKFGQYDSARIMTKGVIWVTASEAVDAGDPVYIVDATGALEKATDTGRTLIANATWDSSTTAAGLAKVRLS